MKCVVPISGGLDSSVILNIAKYDWVPERHNDIYCISFDYGQRHIRELKCAVQQANAIGCKDHTIIDLKFFKDIANISSLTNSDIDVIAS